MSSSEAEENSKNKSVGENGHRYTFAEDMAIVDYITSENRYLQSSGVQVWKIAEAKQICPGRSYSSMKERYKKVISRNLGDYNVDRQLATEIKQFMSVNAKGKNAIRYFKP